MKKRLLYSLFPLMSLYSLSAGAQGLSTFADLLIWHVSEETTAIWTAVVTEPKANYSDFSPKSINFDMSRGFRGGFAYVPENNFWDTKLYWTYMPANSVNRYSPFPITQLIAPEFFSGFVSKDAFFGAKLNWQFIMNMADFEISHQFNMDESLTLRPSLGIKAGTINQTIKAQWYADIYTSTEKVKHNFSGIGPSFGLEGKWNFYKSLSLVGDFSTAFMWGKWDISDKYVRPSAALGLISPTSITTEMDETKLGTLMLDYFLGFEWAYQGRSQVALRVGYEGQYWANQLRTPTFQQLPVHGDLTLGGATCSISIDL